jgi:hypothetical protein
LCRIPYFAARGNESCDAGVCHPKDGAIVFHGPKNRIGQMLPHNRCWSKISIIGNVYQHIGSIMGESSGDVWIRRLNANENSPAHTSNGHQTVAGPGRKVPDDTSYQTRSR